MKKGFTLIELLVTIAIIAILVGIATFAAQGARSQARDARRKADLETIRSGVELFRSDCVEYPLTSELTFGSPLTGDGTPVTACPTTNTYMATVPNDPQSPSNTYYYNRSGTNTYILCARLESAPNPAVDVTGCGNNCGGAACNWRVTNP